MKVKSFFFFAILVLVGMGVYFIVNPSYERSLEAKYFYETKKFEKAYSLAKEAFELDPYNKMASTIMTQSQYSLKYVHYIEDAKKYIKQIENIVNDADGITQSDRAKIRTMAKIMIDAYKKLAPSVVVDPLLIQESQEYYEKFKTLLQKAHQNTN
jgi:tetratricopeptide (TPR) repeat protein